jgi:small subunit ribosomal protein S3Ae
MKGKTKKEYQIISPKLFGKKLIGKTKADKPDKIIGRKFSIYLRDIDRKAQKYYYKFDFKISKVEGDKALTSLVGHEVSRSFVSRSIKKFSTKIDGYIKEKTKDGRELILKPLVITAKNVQTSVAKSIRKKIENFLELYISGNDFEKIMNSILNDELQRDSKKILNTIYPISVVEIRKSEIKIK